MRAPLPLVACVVVAMLACSAGSAGGGSTPADTGADESVALEPTSLVIGGPSSGIENECTVHVNDYGFSLNCRNLTDLTAGVSGVTSGAMVQNLAVTAIWQKTGAPNVGAYTLANLKNALADLQTNLGGKWRAATPSTGSLTITLTEVTPSGVNYAVHGTYEATLPANADSSVNGDETFKATF